MPPEDRLPGDRSPRIVVMGVAGSGKTTVGTALADRLGLPYADADDFHPEANVAKMRTGRPLDDADRLPWLHAVGGWLAAHPDGGIVSCSALRRSHAADAVFLHLAGDADLITARVAARTDHFMPASLVSSQLQLLEPLRIDEVGVVADLARPVAELVDEFTNQFRPAVAAAAKGDPR
jgi:gluconokinase